MNTPTLKYYISEAYGSLIKDPTTAPVDPDVVVETELQELQDALDHRDLAGVDSLSAGTATKINSRGREVALARHLITLMNDWHNEYAHALRSTGIYNGVFQNYAPRDARYRNGPPFYVAEMKNELRVVTTFPADMLANVRDDVQKVTQIPNEDNPIFGNEEQFRSKFTHRWLRRNSTLYPEIELTDEHQQDVLTTKCLTENNVNGLRLEFVDTYGNMIFEDDEETRARIAQASDKGEKVDVIVNNNCIQGVQPTTSLTAGVDGAYLVYPNGKHIDLVRKWKLGESPEETVEKSVFRVLRDPSTLVLPQELVTGMNIVFSKERKMNGAAVHSANSTWPTAY